MAGVARTFAYLAAPIIKTGILASLLVRFVMSWIDFLITIFLSGEGRLPLSAQEYSYIKFEYDAVGAALVSLVIFISISIYLHDRTTGISSGFESEKS